MTASSTTSKHTTTRGAPRTDRAGALAALLVAMNLASPARADEPLRLLITGLPSDGVPASTVTHVRDGLAEAAARYPVRVLPRRDLAELRFLLGCNDDKALAACLQRGRATLGTDGVLLGSIRATEGRDAAVTRARVALRFVDLRVEPAVLGPEHVEEVAVAELAPSRIGIRAELWFHQLVYPTLLADAQKKGLPAPLAAAATENKPAASAAGGAQPTGTASSTPAGAIPPGAAAPSVPDDDIPWDDKPGRRLLAGGVVALVLGAAAFGISIATWRAATSAAPEAHDALSAVAAADPAYAAANAGLFANPSCAAPPTTGPARDEVEVYRARCESGESFASATRALIGTGAVLGAVGITGIVVGTMKARAGDGGKRAALRLRVAPSGFALSF